MSEFTHTDARREALGQAVQASVGQDYKSKDIVGTAEEFFQFLIEEDTPEDTGDE